MHAARITDEVKYIEDVCQWLKFILLIFNLSPEEKLIQSLIFSIRIFKFKNKFYWIFSKNSQHICSANKGLFI